MLDPLWLAASAVDYARSEGADPNVVVFQWYADRHPCDDEVYVADVRILGMGTHIDGTEGA